MKIHDCMYDTNHRFLPETEMHSMQTHGTNTYIMHAHKLASEFQPGSTVRAEKKIKDCPMLASIKWGACTQKHGRKPVDGF
jgi:hypothetical protein